MTSCLFNAVASSVLLGNLSPAEAVDETFRTGVLLFADHIICYSGLALAFAAAIWWLARSPGDPLARAPRRPNTLQPEAVLLAVLVYFLVGWLLMAGLGLDGPTGEAEPGDRIVREGDVEEDASPSERRPPSVGMSLADIVAKVAVLIACLLVASRSFEGGVKHFLFGRQGTWQGLKLSLVLTIVALSLCDLTVRLTMWIVSALRPDYVFEDHGTIQLLNQPGQGVALILALRIGAAVVAPVAEEVFFRGMVQTLLLSVLRSRWVVIMLASLLFALPHQPLHALPALFVLAILLGYAYERTGSLLPPMVIHALFNAKTLLWEALAH